MFAFFRLLQQFYQGLYSACLVAFVDGQRARIDSCSSINSSDGCQRRREHPRGLSKPSNCKTETLFSMSNSVRGFKTSLISLIQDVLPSSKSWNYRVLPLKQIEHPIVRKLPNGGFETLSLDQLPRIQITSHIHPYFVIFAAGYHFLEADVTADDFTDKEEKLLVNTISSLYEQWTQCTPPPWFGDLQ